MPTYRDPSLNPTSQLFSEFEQQEIVEAWRRSSRFVDRVVQIPRSSVGAVTPDGSPTETNFMPTPTGGAAAEDRPVTIPVTTMRDGRVVEENIRLASQGMEIDWGIEPDIRREILDTYADRYTTRIFDGGRTTTHRIFTCTPELRFRGPFLQQRWKANDGTEEWRNVPQIPL